MEFTNQSNSVTCCKLVSSPELLDGLSASQKDILAEAEKLSDPNARWNLLSKKMLTPRDSWLLHKELYDNNYVNCDVAPAWFPCPSASETNVGKMMRDRNLTDYDEFYKWSINSSEEFWDACIKEIGITFDTPYNTVFEMSKGVTGIEYLPGARLNIATSW